MSIKKLTHIYINCPIVRHLLIFGILTYFTSIFRNSLYSVTMREWVVSTVINLWLIFVIATIQTASIGLDTVFGCQLQLADVSLTTSSLNTVVMINLNGIIIKA